MKELKGKEKIYLEQYDVNVNRYLTYAQVQQIANAVLALSKPNEKGVAHDSWAEREQCIDMLVLLHATDIPREVLETLDHDICLSSGLIDEVRGRIINYCDIIDAIVYQESTTQMFKEFAKELPKFVAPLEKVVNKYGGKETKQS